VCCSLSLKHYALPPLSLSIPNSEFRSISKVFLCADFSPRYPIRSRPTMPFVAVLSKKWSGTDDCDWNPRAPAPRVVSVGPFTCVAVVGFCFGGGDKPLHCCQPLTRLRTSTLTYWTLESSKECPVAWEGAASAGGGAEGPRGASASRNGQGLCLWSCRL